MEQQYLDLIKEVLEFGIDTPDRTGKGTLSLFGKSLRFDLSKGFPAFTTKKLYFKKVVSELLWFIEGSCDERRLAEIHYEKNRTELREKKTIWTANADKQGVEKGYENNFLKKDLGLIYSAQWNKENQLFSIIEQIKSDPYSRRHIINSWNVKDLNTMALPPCHYSYQFYVRNNALSCMFVMRSNDLFLGNPFNIASYALLTNIIAKECDLEVGDLVASLGDVHIYKDHIPQCNEQITRNPLPFPELVFEKKPIREYKVGDFSLKNYQHHPELQGDMAV